MLVSSFAACNRPFLPTVPIFPLESDCPASCCAPGILFRTVFPAQAQPKIAGIDVESMPAR